MTREYCVIAGFWFPESTVKLALNVKTWALGRMCQCKTKGPRLNAYLNWRGIYPVTSGLDSAEVTKASRQPGIKGKPVSCSLRALTKCGVGRRTG